MMMEQILREYPNEYNTIYTDIYKSRNLRAGPPLPANLRDTNYFVTLTTGSASQIDCRSGRRSAVYFPIGIMVKKIRNVEIKGKVETLYLTEHGLRLIIDPEALGPISRQDAYIVSSFTGVYAVCKRNDTNCTTTDEFRRETKKWPVLTAKHGYLYTDDVARIDEIAVNYEKLQHLRELQWYDPIQASIYLNEENTTEEEILDQACTKEELYFFSNHRRPVQEANQGDGKFASDYFHPVRFATCTLREGYRSERRIKMISHDIAEQRFRNLVEVMTLRNLNENVLKTLAFLYKTNRYSVPMKPCGGFRQAQDPDLPNIPTAPTGPTAFSGLFDEIVTADARPGLDADRQYFFRIYQPYGKLASLAREEDDGSLFQEIELIVACDDDKPVEAETIIIRNSLLGGDAIELKTDEMFDIYAEYNRIDEDEAAKPFGGVPVSEQRKRLNNGVLFRICELTEYMYWRSALTDMLLDAGPLDAAADRHGFDRSFLAEHFAHLVMASVFDVNLKVRKTRRDKEGCRKRRRS